MCMWAPLPEPHPAPGQGTCCIVDSPLLCQVPLLCPSLWAPWEAKGLGGWIRRTVLTVGEGTSPGRAGVSRECRLWSRSRPGQGWGHIAEAPPGHLVWALQKVTGRGEAWILSDTCTSQSCMATRS